MDVRKKRWIVPLTAMSILFVIAGVSAQTTPTTSPASPKYEQVLGPRTWLFPADHGRHDGYKTEWWYFSGNLRDDTGRRFGYQLTFFRIAVNGFPTTRPTAWSLNDLYFAHAAISDLDGKNFVFKDLMQRGIAGLAESSDRTLDVYVHDWRAKLDQKGDTVLKASDAGFTIDLTADTGVGPVLQGPGGVNAKGPNPGQASYYYSEPQMPTHGKLTIGAKSYDVVGTSWMDHEFASNALASDQVGWDWMALSFPDRSSLMLYRIRNRVIANNYVSGTLISPEGRPTYLAAKDIVMSGSEPWKSPRSGAEYPQQWRVVIPNRDPIIVKTRMTGQELVTPETTDVDYFEGAAEATDQSGHPIGEGYLEMTGYAKNDKTVIGSFLTFLHFAREIWGTP